MKTYYILKMKNWSIDFYKKDRCILPFVWVESDKSFSENYEIIKQFESFADTINVVRRLNEDFIESNNLMYFENKDTLNTKDEKYIKSLEKQLDKAKKLLKKYNNKASCCRRFMEDWTTQNLWEETNKFLNNENF